MSNHKNAETSEQPVDELSRLRDILFGEYARQSEGKLGTLETELEKFRSSVLKELNDMDGRLSNQIEANTQSLEDRISKLQDVVNQRFEALEKSMQQKFAEMDDQKTDRRALGKLLVELGQSLQQ